MVERTIILEERLSKDKWEFIDNEQDEKFSGWKTTMRRDYW